MPRLSNMDGSAAPRPVPPEQRPGRRTGRRGLGLGLAVVVLLAGTATGCGSGTDEPAGSTGTTTPPQRLTVTSPAFEEGEPIPERYTCRGSGERPALAWSGQLDGVVSYAVVVDDPDAPGLTYLHWVVYDIPADVQGLAAADLPAGALEGQNSAGLATWAPPCPPSGQHRYRFHVYALGAKSGLAADAEGNEARRVIESLALGTGTLTGLFGS
ncbi:YbhB/YbcL family Raf kinase inhibitor-like protein [Plantactinospora endophytica]|uniref:YbhB/YbcL family Raf kinase inhibitor-like protein n=1 Tax=Plantactinospora endophytica TaxID=673535 RepID=A0ABQ4DVH8_9ACTN|nr:YbhB/YbcL family Raf kinase inhibitor-like protein [Plantactinospora endophytica]GIG86433.1 hypothetical protein Pen02_13690 [Plantactinospora endophytica]